MIAVSSWTVLALGVPLSDLSDRERRSDFRLARAHIARPEFHGGASVVIVLLFFFIHNIVTHFVFYTPPQKSGHALC
jgi:hypothetical protein